jgi:glucose-6-phosphate 1-dehydrogenase
MPDLRQGCTTGKPSEDAAPADALVLFGAMGDLAHKKIFPALYNMVRHGHLDVPVIGIARAGRTNEHLKERTVPVAFNSWRSATFSWRQELRRIAREHSHRLTRQCFPPA